MKKQNQLLMFLVNTIVPGSDDGFDIFQDHAVPYLDLNKVRLGLDVAMVAQLLLYKAAWSILFAKISDPALRTPALVEEKKALIVLYKPLLRKVIGQAKKSPALTPTDRSELNLPDPNEPRTPIGKPTIAPILSLNKIEHLKQVVRIQDPQNPLSRKRPAGVVLTEIYSFIGATVPTEDQYEPLNKTGRFLYTNTFSMDDMGKTVWYMARYINPRGEAGDTWSDPVSGVVA